MKRTPISTFTVLIGLVVALPASAVTLYGTGDDGSNLYTTNSLNGASTLVGSFGFSATYSVAFSPSNVLYSIVDFYNSSALAKVNTTTGGATLVGSATNIPELMAIIFAPDGTLYAASWGTNDLYTINTTTGVATVVGSLGFGGVMDLAFDPNGNLYALSDSLYKINLSTGAGSLITGLADGCLMGLSIDPSDRFLATDYCTSNSPLYQINTSNGSLTSLGNTGISSPMGLTYQSTAVPEPAGISVLGVGLIGLCFARRRREA